MIAKKIDEISVFVTPDGLGRAGIIRRVDGLFQIYEHWIWNKETQIAFNVAPGGRTTWFGDKTSASDLYSEIDPQPAIYGTFDDAFRSLKSQSKFQNALKIK